MAPSYIVVLRGLPENGSPGLVERARVFPNPEEAEAYRKSLLSEFASELAPRNEETGDPTMDLEVIATTEEDEADEAGDRDRFFRFPVEASIGAVIVRAKDLEQAEERLYEAGRGENENVVRLSWDPEPFDIAEDSADEITAEDAAPHFATCEDDEEAA